MKKDSIFYTVVFSFIIAFIFVFLLSLAYGATKEKVAENARITEARAYLSAAGIEVADPGKIEAAFNSAFPSFDEKAPFNETTVNGKKIVVSPFSGNGLWGTISGVMAVTADLKRMVGLAIISHNETPGLGGRIEEKWFLDQFRGESLSGKIEVIRGSGSGDNDPDNGKVDGITGASRTSSSIEVIVNNKINELKEMIGGIN